jgi:Astacin (Peptidase family M12A)
MTMNKKERQLREALVEIRERAHAVINDDETRDEHGADDTSENAPPTRDQGCIIKSLPARLLIKAAEAAVAINPVNAPGLAAHRAIAFDAEVDQPLRMAVTTAKYWGPTPRRLTVSFMGNTPADLQTRIISHMNAWTKTGGISFVATSGVGNVRISRGPGGYYSYLGTDILLIPANRQTMNLEGFTMNTSESEYKRVVRHETGHTLGAPHEHMRRDLVARIDPIKAYAYFLRTQGWNKAMVDAQVLTPLDERTILSTPSDQDSIMCYQLPGSITRDGRPIRGGLDINASDYAFVGKIYPKPSRDQTDDREFRDMPPEQEEDWPESEDVELVV